VPENWVFGHTYKCVVPVVPIPVLYLDYKHGRSYSLFPGPHDVNQVPGSGQRSLAINNFDL